MRLVSCVSKDHTFGDNCGTPLLEGVDAGGNCGMPLLEGVDAGDKQISMGRLC